MDEVTDVTFEALVSRASGPVVVEFWAPWCVPCAKLGPVLEALERSTGAVRFLKLDVDSSPVTAARLGVLSIPTVIVFENGEPQTAIAGLRRREVYEQALDPRLARARAERTL